ncbi:MAG: DivIVA domain-containing protein [Lachnospiraceae bacterium]|nr:DivIVA domain-containing protein [Lachnospiraceae bacterium]
MLTPIEIQSRVFKSVGLGYDKKDVDSFMKEIVESYEALYREKMELMDKINVLNSGIQNYKAMEKTMQKALVLAQKTADDTQETAMRNAHVIEKEALAKADLIVNDARRSLEQIHQKTILLAQQYEKYKLQFKSLAAAQVELLESESFQFHIMELPKTEIPKTEQEAPKPLEMPVQKTVSEETLPKIDISFTNAASQE